MSYLFHFSYIVLLVYTESLYRHSLIVIDAFPYIAKATIGDGILSRPYECFGNDVGGRQKSLPAAQLSKLSEDRDIVCSSLKGLCRASVLRTNP